MMNGMLRAKTGTQSGLSRSWAQKKLGLLGWNASGRVGEMEREREGRRPAGAMAGTPKWHDHLCYFSFFCGNLCYLSYRAKKIYVSFLSKKLSYFSYHAIPLS